MMPTNVLTEGECAVNREELLTQIEELLRQHKDGLRGSVHQEPYKGDFFRLFAAAFNGGLLTVGHPGYLSADALTDILTSRAPELVDDEAWQILHGCWQEWTYAWRHVGLLK